ncbi:MAG: molybdopterin-dependent oxidoreductase [Desulfosalsimonadaceae bacterium]
MESIVLTINGQKVTCPAGVSILTAADQHGIKIPTLCYHPDLKPHGACRMCLVEDEATGRLMASCVTPAAAGMSVLTHTPRILNHRRNIVRLMMAEHPESCIVCSKGNRCELRKIAAILGVGDSGLYPMPNPIPYEQLNPFITRDLSKCILCGKCIRADHDLVVTGAIDYNLRGFRSRPATLYEKPLEDSICTFCGTCVSICPTGALAVKNTRYVGTPERETDSICGFCGAGCSLTVGVSGRIVVEVNPSRRKVSVNAATLCMRGHFAGDFLNSPDRLTLPLVRNPDPAASETHVPTEWDAAISQVATRLSDIRRAHGPGSLAFIGSSKCSNEENYLFQKIAREIIGTPHVMSAGYGFGQRLLAKIDEKTLGAGRVSPLSDLENAEVIVVVQADPENSVPVAGYHIKRASQKGARLIVVDAERTDLARRAALWMQPGSSGASGVLDALAGQLVADNQFHREFVDQFCTGFDRLRDSVAGIGPDYAPLKGGISFAVAKEAADLMHGKKTAFVMPANLLDFPDGNQTLDAVLNLCFLTGCIGPKSSGLYVLLPENNLAGALDMGVAPDLLPGRVRITDAGNKGMELGTFIAAAESGQIKAAYIMGENLLRSLPQQERVAAALKNLEFLVVQDIVRNRTAELADVILPGAAVYEKHGSFTNMEGRIQTFGPAVPPPGQARPDWEILGQLVRAMGYPEQYQSIEKIRQEIRHTVPMYQGLGNHYQEWVRNTETGNPFVSSNTRFPLFQSIDLPLVPSDPAYPILAHIRPVRYHLGSGTRTSRSERIQAYGRLGEVELAPETIRSLGGNGSGKIRVTSRFGSIERAFKENRNLPEGLALIPMAVNRNDAINLADLMSSADASTGGWTISRVRIEKI